MLKAFWVTIKDFHDVNCYVMAESPSKAKRAAMWSDDGDCLRDAGWTELRAIRIPALDGGITDESLISSGRMWSECNCGKHIEQEWEEWECEPDDDVCDGEVQYREPVYVGGRAFCSQECADRWGDPKTEGKWNGICLYVE